MNYDVTKTIRERGLLVEKNIFEFLQNLPSEQAAIELLSTLEKISGQRVITRALLAKYAEHVQKIANQIYGSNKEDLEKVYSDLGIVNKTQDVQKEKSQKKPLQKYQIFYADTKVYKKLEVQDFVNNFRSRYQTLQKILLQRPDLQNLVSINKIGSNRQNLSIIGLVKEKRVTKNKNIILVLEDLTGEISAVIRSDRPEVFAKAQEVQFDEVIAIKGSGNKDLIFVYDIYFPDAFKYEKIRFEEEICLAFISDLHCGSDRHLSKSIQKFLDWLNSNDETAKKIKYLFVVGDTVDGTGIFPGQEQLLALKSMKEQYALLASYLRQVPKEITIFLCPGQHDATRVAEPQPIIDREYAPYLYEIENLVLVTNPATIKLIEKDKSFNVLMYHGASIHDFINEIPELREKKAHKTPAKAVKYMLKKRHLAPMHSSVTYLPGFEEDPLLIKEVPDLVCTGEVHRLDIENYNGILIITGSCWQSQTPFEEKIGNIPDPGKVPVFNLKTREIKIFDFLVEEEIKNK